MYSHLALSENGFLFDSQTGKSYTLNPSGVYLLRQLINGEKPACLGLRLVNAFEVESTAAARDAQQFVLRLIDLHVISAEGEG